MLLYTTPCAFLVGNGKHKKGEAFLFLLIIRIFWLFQAIAQHESVLLQKFEVKLFGKN